MNYITDPASQGLVKCLGDVKQESAGARFIQKADDEARLEQLFENGEVSKKHVMRVRAERGF